MFRRRRSTDADWHVEDTAARIGRMLAQKGPHDDRIGHHRTQEGNTDPTKTSLALVRPPKPLIKAQPMARLLCLTKARKAARA